MSTNPRAAWIFFCVPQVQHARVIHVSMETKSVTRCCDRIPCICGEVRGFGWIEAVWIQPRTEDMYHFSTLTDVLHVCECIGHGQWSVSGL